MKTISAGEANRHFSRLLRTTAEGDDVLILSRGRAVARLVPATGSPERQRRAEVALMHRLVNQPATGTRGWSRDELYGR